mmetsp:Transcript_30054/g.96159  ORF Transcript_30054/g.96159 Transcript_30054/m.96159 type:complete len:272 (+) Transcript_30054:506-1321(+)
MRSLGGEHTLVRGRLGPVLARKEGFKREERPVDRLCMPCRQVAIPPQLYVSAPASHAVVASARAEADRLAASHAPFRKGQIVVDGGTAVALGDGDPLRRVRSLDTALPPEAEVASDDLVGEVTRMEGHAHPRLVHGVRALRKVRHTQVAARHRVPRVVRPLHVPHVLITVVAPQEVACDIKLRVVGTYLPLEHEDDVKHRHLVPGLDMTAERRHVLRVYHNGKVAHAHHVWAVRGREGLGSQRQLDGSWHGRPPIVDRVTHTRQDARAAIR